MTISVERNYKVHTGNGSATQFAYDFLIPAADEVAVWLYTISTDTLVRLATSAYSITGVGDDAGGTVTYPLGGGTAIASTHKLIIATDIPFTQTVELSAQSAFSPTSLNTALDRLLLQILQGSPNSLRKPAGLEYFDATALKIRNVGTGVEADDAATVGQMQDALGATEIVNALSSRAAIPAASVSAAVSYLWLAGAAAAGDGGEQVMKVVGAQPTHDGWEVSSNGKFLEITPHSEIPEIIDFEYHCRKFNNHRTRVIEACKDLFNSGSAPMKLECHGIPQTITAPILLRGSGAVEPGATLSKVLTLGAGVGSAEKTIAGLHLTKSGAWTAGDYLFSLAGEAGIADLRYFILDSPVFNIDGEDITALHLSGYYHATIINPRIRGLTSGSIGILSSRYAISTGTGTPGGRTDNVNHGLAIIEPDIRGTSGAVDTSIGIYLEDGDAHVQGGWLTFLNEGIVTKRGGLNTRGVHFSMADGAAQKTAVRCDAPRAMSLWGDELDGCNYYFKNPTDNMFTPGSSLTSWSNISIRGTKFSGAKLPTANRGLITFETITANEVINGLVIAPDWNTLTGNGANAADLRKFHASGAGSWLGSGFNDVVDIAPHNFGIAPGDYPTGVKARVFKSDTAFVRIDTVSGRVELSDATTGGDDQPYFGAVGDDLVFGRYVNGVVTHRWRQKENGHWQPEADDTYGVGAAGLGIKHLIMADGAAVGVGGAATLNKPSGIITSAVLTTAAGANYTLTLTNDRAFAVDKVFWSVQQLDNTTGLPVPAHVKITDGQIVFVVRNVHATDPFNARIQIMYMIVKDG